VNREQHGPIVGLVSVWHEDEGWGAIRSRDVEGEIWAHFAHIAGDGYRTLSADDLVTVTYETPGQDGYPHRAVKITPGRHA
jgi:CspA family cold shock protein